MQKVWHLAGEALRQAELVEVWGYSLPASDMAVRALLNILRFRLANHEVRVRVHERVPEVRDRWREFLGETAEIDAQPLE